MAEKLLDKLKRISTDLADSVRAELELKDSLRSTYKELKYLKKCVACYIQEKEKISNESEAISFIKGYYEAKSQENKDQLKFGFDTKNLG